MKSGFVQAAIGSPAQVCSSFSHLYIFNFGLGQQELFVIVTLPLFSLRLELQHSFLGLSQSLSEVGDLKQKNNNKLQAQSGK